MPPSILGPSTLAELFQWHVTAVNTLLDCATDTNNDDEDKDIGLMKLAGLRLVTTTEFSGMGTAELAVEMIIDALGKHVPDCAGAICCALVS